MQQSGVMPNGCYDDVALGELRNVGCLNNELLKLGDICAVLCANVDR